MGIHRSAILTKVARVNRRENTPAEKRLWSVLKGSNLDGWKFRRQIVIDQFIVDFCCPEHKIVIELDGEIHNGQEAQDADALRTHHLNAFGYQVIRFRNEAVLDNLPEVLMILRTTLQKAK